MYQQTQYLSFPMKSDEEWNNVTTVIGLEEKLKVMR